MTVVRLLTLLASALAAPLWAAPCAVGSFDQYTSLGLGGCEIQGSVFNNFALLPLGNPAATQIPGAAITVTPVNVLYAPGFVFTLNATASAGTLLEAILSYQAVGQLIVTDTLSTTGAVATEDALVSVVSYLCAGGAFDPGTNVNCTGTPDTFLVFTSAFDEDSQEVRLVPGVPQVQIVHDISLDAGLTGTASLGSVINTIEDIPEPQAGLLAASGMALLAALRMRRQS